MCFQNIFGDKNMGFLIKLTNKQKQYPSQSGSCDSADQNEARNKYS